VGPDDLSRFRDDAARELARFVERRRAELTAVGPDLAPFLDAAADFVAGGKRLRAAFCLAGWLVAGGDPDEPAIVTAAASLEWLQGSALVHDDLMDGSDTRRGHPSAHRAFEAEHRGRGEDAVGDPERFGLAASVLLGDLMLSWADEQLRASGLPRVPEALRYLDLCRSEVVAGQYLDVLAQTRPAVSVEEAMTIVRFKAGSYTVERPLHIGAALAGAGDDLIAGLSAVAVPLGQAFQLRDDVLGVFGDPATTGKPAGDDLREGKRTVLVARAAELGSDDDRRQLARLLGTREGVEPLTELVVSTGALAAVERDIARLEGEVDAAIDALGPRARDTLGPLARSATRRTS
jgi:geranylgeranyl diphosphate synthase type I